MFFLIYNFTFIIYNFKSIFFISIHPENVVDLELTYHHENICIIFHIKFLS